MKNLINIAKDYIVVDTEAESKYMDSFLDKNGNGFYIRVALLPEDTYHAHINKLPKLLYSTNKDHNVPLMLKENVEAEIKKASEIKELSELRKNADVCLTEMKDKDRNHVSTLLNKDEEISFNTGYFIGIKAAYHLLSQRKWTDEDMDGFIEWVYATTWRFQRNGWRTHYMKIEDNSKTTADLRKMYLASLTSSTEMTVEGEEKDGIYTVTKIVIQ